MASQPTEIEHPLCPACRVAVEPGMPACPSCGERLYVEHPGAFPRDARAVDEEAYRRAPDEA